MKEDYGEIFETLQDQTPEGKQARETIGHIYLIRLHQRLEDIDNDLQENTAYSLLNCYGNLIIVFRKLKSILDKKESESLKPIIQKCKDKAIVLQKDVNDLLSTPPHMRVEGYTPICDGFKEVLEDFSQEICTACNNHNLNLPFRKTNDSGMGVE